MAIPARGRSLTSSSRGMSSERPIAPDEVRARLPAHTANYTPKLSRDDVAAAELQQFVRRAS